MTNLRLSIDISRLNTEEVLIVLAEHFGYATMGEGRISFQRQDSSAEVEISRRGRIVNISLGKELSADESEMIRRKLEQALVIDQSPAVGQYIGFCSSPVEGYFRFRDRLQILPMPNEAPRPTVLLADHPFLLQYIYTWSPNQMVRTRRRIDQARACLRLLDLLSGTRMHGGSGSVRHAWIIPNGAEHPSEWRSEWRQLGYTYVPTPPAEIQSLINVVDCAPIVLVPAQQHFENLSAAGHALVLPDDIGTALQLAFALQIGRRERFERSLIYREHGQTVWNESRSLAYIAMIMAIEALIDDSDRCAECNQALLEGDNKCRVCGQFVFSTTRTFRQFLETYAPAVRDEPRIRARLYSLRSDLAHGNDVLLEDTSILAIYEKYVREEFALESALGVIADTAIRNWLLTQTSC